MKKLRILALMHADLVPPDGRVSPAERAGAAWKTEYDVCTALRALGHEVMKLGIRDEILPIKTAIDTFAPHVAFNLLEEFRGETVLDQHVVAFLELHSVAYTGCNPRGLMLARDKALAKKILAYHRVHVPAFAVYARGRRVARPKRLRFPLIVKSLVEEASLGIAQASVVDSDERLVERVRFIHERINTDAIVEEYIDGRELYAGVLGTSRMQVLPTWELVFRNMPPGDALIATRKAKWDLDYQKRHEIDSQAARLPPEVEGRIAKVSKRVYRSLGLSGYARLDFRMRASDGELFLLEANPNPDIARDEDLAAAAQAAGLSYERLLQRIVNIGCRAPSGAGRG